MRRSFLAFPLAALAFLAAFQYPSPAFAQSLKAEKAAPATRPQAPLSQAEITQAAKRPECAWTGQRIVSLLWRDDVNTAREQTRFYDLFGCPSEHLPVAFRCVIENSEKQPEQNDLTARVYGCWMEPEVRSPQE